MLGNFINDMMDLAKIQSNTFQFNDEFFDLEKLVNSAFDQVRFQADKNGILLK